jgi:hypothetical protein
MGILNKTKFLVIGPIQYFDGRGIREYFKQELTPLGITVFDHYAKPYVTPTNEGKELGAQFKEWMKNREFEKVAAYKEIRRQDLNLVDRCDAIIVHFIPGVVTCGTWDEFFLAARLKRPIFFITETGAEKTPYWVVWTIPQNQLYDSKEQCLDTIKKIDSGEIPIDLARWRLLREEFR